MTSPGDEAEIILDLHVSATEEGMDAVHAALAGCWSSLERTFALDERWRDEFSLAVAEIAANIIQYSHNPHTPQVEFTLSLMHFPDRLTACFIDRGVAVEIPKEVPMPSIAVDVEAVPERGRGLAIVQATTDRFECLRTSEDENVWLIEKYFPGRVDTPASAH
jgi:anti-sigma regulatory factor (Ser/Thr protein kinase)